MKACNRCGQELPLSSFGVNRAKEDGAHTKCKRCRSIVEAAYREKDPHRFRRAVTKWRRAHPEIAKHHRTKYFNAHRDDYARRATAWLNAHPEAKKAYTASYRARLRNAPGKHAAAEIRALMKAQDGRCALCGTDITKKYSADHILAISRGGSNDIANIQLTCPPCNSRKYVFTQQEFLRRIGRQA